MERYGIIGILALAVFAFLGVDMMGQMKATKESHQNFTVAGYFSGLTTRFSKQPPAPDAFQIASIAPEMPGWAVQDMTAADWLLLFGSKAPEGDLSSHLVRPDARANNPQEGRQNSVTVFKNGLKRIAVIAEFSPKPVYRAIAGVRVAGVSNLHPHPVDIRAEPFKQLGDQTVFELTGLPMRASVFHMALNDRLNISILAYAPPTDIDALLDSMDFANVSPKLLETAERYGQVKKKKFFPNGFPNSQPVSEPHFIEPDRIALAAERGDGMNAMIGAAIMGKPEISKNPDAPMATLKAN